MIIAAERSNLFLLHALKKEEAINACTKPCHMALLGWRNKECIRFALKSHLPLTSLPANQALPPHTSMHAPVEGHSVEGFGWVPTGSGWHSTESTPKPSSLFFLCKHTYTYIYISAKIYIYAGNSKRRITSDIRLVVLSVSDGNHTQQVQHDSKDGFDFSSAKHCRLEAIAEQCVNTVDVASHQWEKAHASVRKMSGKHIEDVEALVRDAMGSNDQHDVEVDTLSLLAEDDVKRNNSDIIGHFSAVLEHDKESISAVMTAVEAHSACLQELSRTHDSLTSDINCCAGTTFQHDYMVYEASGNTPVRSETDVPSKGTIESLRTMPMDALLEEFKENNPYESTKDPKPSLIPRPPLLQIN